MVWGTLLTMKKGHIDSIIGRTMGADPLADGAE
jgi:hypothetical protein